MNGSVVTSDLLKPDDIVYWGTVCDQILGRTDGAGQASLVFNSVGQKLDAQQQRRHGWESSESELPEVFGQHTTSFGLHRSEVTREPSARTEAQDSSPCRGDRAN